LLGDFIAKVKITTAGYRCEKCGHEWIKRGKLEPVQCPKCKSARWDEPKQTKTEEQKKEEKRIEN
jgi:predicted Zn-ribbon and HTH transcriptional regulator